MLVLARRENEEIVIEPAGIRLVVVGVRGNGKDSPYIVRLGFEAPPTQSVWRTELLVKHLEQATRKEVSTDGTTEKSGHIPAANPQVKGLPKGSTERHRR